MHWVISKSGLGVSVDVGVKDLVTPNISACRKIDNTLLIKALFISWKMSN
jgi:hypothetical protein